MYLHHLTTSASEIDYSSISENKSATELISVNSSNEIEKINVALFGRYQTVTVGNTTDHSSDQYDIALSAMNLAYFTGLGQYVRFQLLPGQNYGNLTVYITDQNFIFEGLGFVKMQGLSFVNVVGVGADKKLFMFVNNIYFYSTANTISTFTESGGIPTPKLYIVFNECIIHRTQDASGSSYKFADVSECEYLCYENCKFIYSLTTATALTTFLFAFDVRNERECIFHVKNNTFIYEFYTNSTVRPTIFYERSKATATGRLNFNFVENQVIYQNKTGSASVTMDLYFIYSEGRNLAAPCDFRVSRNFFDCQGLGTTATKYSNTYYNCYLPNAGASALGRYIYDYNTYIFSQNFNHSSFKVLLNNSTTIDPLLFFDFCELLDIYQDATPTYITGTGAVGNSRIRYLVYNANLYTYNLATLNFAQPGSGVSAFLPLPGSATGTMIIQNTGTGQLFYQTSSQEYKDNIRELNIQDLERLLSNIDVKEWENIQDGTPGISPIVEEINTNPNIQDLKNKVLFYNSELCPTSINQSNIIFGCLRLIQDLRDRISVLESYHF